MGQIKKRNRLDFARLCSEVLGGQAGGFRDCQPLFFQPFAKQRKMKGLAEKTCYSWRLE